MSCRGLSARARRGSLVGGLRSNSARQSLSGSLLIGNRVLSFAGPELPIVFHPHFCCPHLWPHAHPAFALYGLPHPTRSRPRDRQQRAPGDSVDTRPLPPSLHRPAMARLNEPAAAAAAGDMETRGCAASFSAQPRPLTSTCDCSPPEIPTTEPRYRQDQFHPVLAHTELGK